MQSTMKPWDDAVFQLDDEDEVDRLWAATTADEFYVAPTRAYGEDGVAITPVAMFDQDKEMWDQHLAIDHLLPAGMDCKSEGIYDVVGTLEDTMAMLAAAGFRQSDEFTAFIKATDDDDLGDDDDEEEDGDEDDEFDDDEADLDDDWDEGDEDDEDDQDGEDDDEG